MPDFERTARSTRSRAPLATGLVLMAPLAAQTRPGILREGQPLPHLPLPTIDGRQVLDLAELAAGRKLLLIQFASW